MNGDLLRQMLDEQKPETVIEFQFDLDTGDVLFCREKIGYSQDEKLEHKFQKCRSVKEPLPLLLQQPFKF